MAERPVPDTDTLAAETRRLLDACPSQGTVDYYTDALHRAYDERDDLAARLAAITAAISDPDVVAEVRDRVAEMRGIADSIVADPGSIANEVDVQQWRRDAELLELLLAAITAAISDLHRPMWDDPTAPGFYQTEPHREGDPAIGCCTCGTDGWPCPTAASLSPTPTPDHCPTCRGTWKIVRGQHPHYACSNVAWHDSQG